MKCMDGTKCEFADQPNHQHVGRDTVAFWGREPSLLDFARADALLHGGRIMGCIVQDAPWAGPPAFVDPLEQLELGRLADAVRFAEVLVGALPQWHRSMLRGLTERAKALSSLGPPPRGGR